MTAEPFSLNSETNFTPSDSRTRITLFCMNLDFLSGEPASALTADAQDGTGTLYPLKVEYVGTVPNFPGLYMVVVRLNDLMSASLGDVLVRLNLHGLASNRARVAIGQVGGGPADDSAPNPAPATPPGAPTPLTLAQYQAQYNDPAFASDNDLKRFLEREVGPERTRRYWELFEQLRNELGYADYLGALQRYRDDYPRDPHVLHLSPYLIDYPFANRLYPESLDVIERLKELGQVAILSDGDVVFQPRKVDRAGLTSAVDDNVLIYVHKEKELDDVAARFPAEHYVVVDDKLRILAAVKKVWGERVTTIFPRQGHYAHDPAILATEPPADITVDRIGDILRLNPKALLS